MIHVPDGWQIKTLGDVCVVERGSSPRPIKTYFTDDPDGVNWIKIGDTKGVDKFIHSTKQKITKKGAERSRRVNPGDFILSNSMPVSCLRVTLHGNVWWRDRLCETI